MIDARPVRFPVYSPSVSTATLYFEAPTASMRRWLPADLDLIGSEGASTQVVVILTSYVGGQWGSYDTLDVALRTRPAGCTDPHWAGLFFLDAVVNERFPTEVSYWVLGIGHRYGAIGVSGGLVGLRGRRGRPAPALGPGAVATSDTLERRTARIYAHVGGALHVIPLVVDMPAPSSDVSCVEVEVGGGRLGAPAGGHRPAPATRCLAWGGGQTVTVREPLRVVPAQPPVAHVVPD
jgi:hypothetical protein